MPSKRLAALGALAILPVFAQVQNSQNAQDTTEKIARHQHGPIRDLKNHFDGTSTSSNWSGYAVLGSSFNAAAASWIVPASTCSSGNQYASFWVGLDGYSSSTVEQTGTDSDCVGKNPSYYAWYEFYPHPSFEITSLSIKPGDVMEATVVYKGGAFTVTIVDKTTGKAFRKSSTVSGAKRSSAEWIAEAPCCTAGGGILPLADYGTVLFGLDSTGATSTNFAFDSTTKGPIGAFPTIEQITMAKSGVMESVPSELSNDGTSFSVTWFAQ